MNSSQAEAIRPDEQQSCQFIEEYRTYTRAEVISIQPWLDDDFWPVLVECFGLIPLGTDKNQIISGRNLIEALTNHARGRVVERQRKPITREHLKKLYRKLKLEVKSNG